MTALTNMEETVSEWSCPLEDPLATAVELGQVERTEVDEMLRCMFWAGL